MRLLANENFPGDAVDELRRKGHDVAWIRTDAPGSNDVEVLERAKAEARIIITFDKDFGELAFRERLPAPCGIILFRIAQPSSSYVARYAAMAIESVPDPSGMFIIVQEGRIRIRTLSSRQYP